MHPSLLLLVHSQTQSVSWQLLHIGVLREYLAFEFRNPDIAWFDLERVIDDMVLLMTLVGNDFIPHSPSLDIGEGHIQLLFGMYKKLLPSFGGYVVDAGMVDFGRLESICRAVGEYEDEIFSERDVNEAAFERKRERRDRKGFGNSSTPAQIGTY